MNLQNDTIAAIATPPGTGGVAVIRVSGPDVKNIAEKILGSIPEPRQAKFSFFRDQNADLIDEGMSIYFPAPASFTGEEVLEIQGHGGSVVQQCLMQALIEMGARQARPGEFSERAFLNGKMDLIQAEAVADLINSTSQQAAKSALRSLNGEFSQQIDLLREKLIYLRTYIEALLDFSDEELDYPRENLQETLLESLAMVKEIREKARQGAVLNEGIRIAIIGPPNVGKSSLLNYFLQQDRAIVTDIAGTTRDTLTEKFTLYGIPFLITDTAGLRETHDPVEKQGIQRTKKAITTADLIIEMYEYGLVTEREALEEKGEIQRLIVYNKIDKEPKVKASRINDQDEVTINLSVKKNEGLDLLEQELINFAGRDTETEGVFAARQRHLVALEKTEEFLQQALPAMSNVSNYEIAAENLRLGLQTLGEITGEFTTEDLLGEIFSGFCIGK